MKQSILRRMGALALSLAMALTIAVTPAMAAVMGITGVPAAITKGKTASITAVTAATPPEGQALVYDWISQPANAVSFSPNGTKEAATTTMTAVDTETEVTIQVVVTAENDPSTVLDRLEYKGLTITEGGGSTTDPVKVTGITVTPETLSLAINDSKVLSAAVTPDDAANQEVTWGTSNASVATVDDKGKVTAIGRGNATITATAKDGSKVEGTCAVSVSGIAPVSMSFAIGGSLTLSKGEQRGVGLVAQPSSADVPKEIEWSSSDTDEKVVKLVPNETSPGQAALTGVNPGAATITAKTPDGVTATLNVEVSGIVITNKGERVDADTSIPLIVGERLTFGVEAYGAAKSYASVIWTSDDNSVAYTSGSTSTVTAYAPGTALITATKSIPGGRDYWADCNVRVMEDTSALITLSSISAGSEKTLSDIRSGLAQAARKKGYSSVDYVTNLSVSTDQGILYYGYYYEGDTGAGVGMERYYLSPNTSAGQLGLSDLGFVARTTFSGTAEISYVAWCGSNSFNGIIRIPVTAMNDVVYSTTRDRPVTFQSIDFNAVCRTKNGRDLRSVTFTLPQSTSGTLYFDYDTLGENGQQVTAGTAYGRTSAPYLDSVTFVPAQTCPRTVTIGYQGTDVSGKTFSGRVTINVSGGTGNSSDVVRSTDVRYTGNWGDQIIFRATDFASASLATINEQLSYVQFHLPSASQGTLYFNYNSSGSYSNLVTSTTSYYSSGAPAIGGVSFVPASTANSRVTIGYTGFGVRGNTFTGTIYIDYGDPANPTLRYSTYSGKLVTLSAADFNSACVAATGSTLNYVQFTGLPGNAQGVLYYDYRSSQSYHAQASTWNNYYRSASGSQNQLGLVSFLASKDYTGTVRIPYTGYSTDNNRTSFTGTVVIQVAAPAPNDINLNTTTSNPVKLSSATVRSVCYAVMDQELSYIQITSLPPSTAGQLYSNYSNGTGTAVNTGARFYRAGAPGIDQLTFVPRGGFQGTATIGYTGVSTSGQQVSGRINIAVGRTGTSGYFNDMGNYAWAADAVDYLYRSGVVTGMGNGEYGPSLPIRRCDFVVMLCRAFKLNGSGGYSFADVPVNSYYAQALATAKNLGIVSGDGSNFYPNNNLSRQDAMVMIFNTLQATGHKLTNGLTADLSIFLDQGQIAPYARNSVGILVYLGAVKGDGNGYLRPRSTINRAEAAILIQFIMAM